MSAEKIEQLLANSLNVSQTSHSNPFFYLHCKIPSTIPLKRFYIESLELHLVKLK